MRRSFGSTLPKTAQYAINYAAMHPQLPMNDYRLRKMSVDDYYVEITLLANFEKRGYDCMIRALTTKKV